MRHLLRAEWTKFRSVPAWPLTTAAAALFVVLFAVLTGLSGTGRGGTVPTGPGGEPVTDSFYLVHQELTGDGSLTIEVTSLAVTVAGNRTGDVVPWAKAGLIIKAGTDPGSTYAAIMVTSRHGVRMQDDYVHDTAGLPGEVSPATPRWLRLTRTGDTVVGEDSADGTHWATVGTAHLAGLPATVSAGPFVACPSAVEGRGTVTAQATAGFGTAGLAGRWSPGTWNGTQVGRYTAGFGGYPGDGSGGFASTAGGFTVTGAGDIAPAVRQELPMAGVVGDLLIGTFAALIALIAVGTLYITTEYRHRMIGTTLTAAPHPARVLLAKAVVLGGVTFLAGVLASALAVPIGARLARAHGIYLFPAAPLTLLRVEVGTGALLAGAAVLALAAGAVLRRSAAAVTTVIVATVLPYLLVIIPILPPAPMRWLTLVTPAAALSVQQTLTPYPQVASVYSPANGYYPLPPWAGLAVLCGYAGLVLALAVALLRRRDA